MIHRYVSHIDPQTWNDLTTIKEYINSSFDDLIKEGCRMVVGRSLSLSPNRKNEGTVCLLGVSKLPTTDGF